MPNGDLRVARDPHRLGINLWVIERKVPAAEHAAGLEQLRLNGYDRYIHCTGEDGVSWHYDCAPEWVIASICRTEHCTHDPAQFSAHDPECHREPDMKDIAELRQWLYEFRDFEHSRQVLTQEARDHKQQVEADATKTLAKEIKSSKDFRQLVYSLPGDGHGSTTERINER